MSALVECEHFNAGVSILLDDLVGLIVCVERIHEHQRYICFVAGI